MNRAFLGRVVHFLAVERGIRQFLDIGSGLPTASNVHEIAQAAAPDARVVYVDNDPVVVLHAQAILEDRSKGVAAVRGDLRDPAGIAASPAVRELIDFSQPVAVLLFAVLHFVPDADDPGALLAWFRDAMAPGSALALSHITDENLDEEARRAGRAVYQGTSAPIVPRSRAQIEGLFDGLDLMPPGVTGIVGDMGVHMLDTTRWMLGLGWPKRITSTGGIFVQKEGKSNISDTQTATFAYDGLNVVWEHRTWGASPDPKYPWSMTLYGDKGTLKASTMSYDFLPEKGEPIHKDCLLEREQYPEDVHEPRIELNAAPATRAHMKNFLAAIESRGKPIADIEEGHISTASCILANMSMQLGGRELVYDSATKQVIGDTEATALLKRQFRGPWTHPADGLS